MYRLLIYVPSERAAHHQITVQHAAEVLITIPRLLSEHDGCDRIEVRMGSALLFSVDCAGNRLD